MTVLCVVPQRLEEGQEIALAEPELELALGQPVVFPLYTSTVRGHDRAGETLSLRPDQLLQLPPLHTILRGGKRAGSKRVPVTLAAKCTEIGTLELWCVAREGGNRWRLEFNIRDVVSADGPSVSADQGAQRRDRPALADVWPEELVQTAASLIRTTFDSDNPQPHPRELTKALETALDAPRHRWPVALCRRLWDFLAGTAENRRRSRGHRAQWYYLAGYCLRPGFGDPLDRFRVEQLWKTLQTPPRTNDPAGSTKPSVRNAPPILEGGADYWIMWRRVAGGLNVQLQNALYERLRSVLLPAKGKTVAKPGANELAEMWRAAASLERLDVKQKELLGHTLLKALRRSPTPTYGFWALTRLGARTPFYGPLNAVIHPEVVQKWLDAVLSFKPAHQSERVAWAFCLAQLARRSGQRALDIDDAQRERVAAVLRSLSVQDHWTRMVEEVLEVQSEEQAQLFGESLPIGLRLMT